MGSIGRITTTQELKDAYARVQERVARAAARVGRKPSDLILVAVTKTATPDQIRTLVEMGQIDFGENRVQVLQQRVAQLQEYLQRRKAMGGASTRGEAETVEPDTEPDTPAERQAAPMRTPASPTAGRLPQTKPTITTRPIRSPELAQYMDILGSLRRPPVLTPTAAPAGGGDAAARAPEPGVKNQNDRLPAKLTGAAAGGAPAGAPQRGGKAAATNPSPGVRWHMIGRLQRNKAKAVIPLVRLIHSVDSLRLAEELHVLGARCDQPIEVLLQVNISGEESKTGVAGPAALHVAEQIETMVNLRLRGLMTIAPYADKPEESRPIFARTRELFEEIKTSGVIQQPQHFNLLSMGMTDDFEAAIEEGANILRVGRAIFGELPEGYVEPEEH